MAKREERGKMVLTIIFTVICIAYIMPILIVLMNSFKSNAAVNTQTFAFPDANSVCRPRRTISRASTFGNYPFLKAVGYSLFITLASTALILVLSTSMAAWYRRPRRRASSRKIVLSSACSPWSSRSRWSCSRCSRTAEPAQSRHPVDDPGRLSRLRRGSRGVHVHAALSNPFRWKLRRPPAIDGCGPVRTFFSGGTPHAEADDDLRRRCWRSCGCGTTILLPYLVLDRTEYMTIPIVIQHLKGSYGQVDMGATMALILLSILPVIIFYLCCQKHIIKGVAAGAVKG